MKFRLVREKFSYKIEKLRVASPHIFFDAKILAYQAQLVLAKYNHVRFICKYWYISQVAVCIGSIVKNNWCETWKIVGLLVKCIGREIYYLRLNGSHCPLLKRAHLYPLSSNNPCGKKYTFISRSKKIQGKISYENLQEETANQSF